MVRAIYKGNNEILTFRGARNEEYGLNKKEITFDGVKGKVRWKEGEETELSQAPVAEMEMLSG